MRSAGENSQDPLATGIAGGPAIGLIGGPDPFVLRFVITTMTYLASTPLSPLSPDGGEG